MRISRLQSIGQNLVERFGNKFEAIVRNGNFYLKQPNGKYYSVNSLSEIER